MPKKTAARIGKKKVRVALIGAGGMANGVHYPSLTEFKDVEMVALCDLVKAKRDETGKRFGIKKLYHGYQQMLDEVKCDAVYVLMPPHHLYDIVVTCLNRKLDVFIEKPPALTTFQVSSMARLAAKNRCVTMVGFNRRYTPMLTDARATAAKKGRIQQVNATFYKNASAVYYDGAIDVIGCDAIHAVDALRWLAGGEVVNVAAAVNQFNDVVPNAWNAIVTFDSGCVGVLQTNWSTGGRIHTFEVHATGYSAYVEPQVDLEEVDDKGRRRRTIDEFVKDPNDTKTNFGFYQQARAFIDAVKSRKPPGPNFADALKTMMLVDAIRRNDVAFCPGLDACASGIGTEL
ncbi:MAG: Gfo/Idh/MocA family oxidoreductase [Phycisphaerae bacterium]|nr:Gfo/Idh/MocA family oxidoreductase [Phycisphaerae bacterium]